MADNTPNPTTPNTEGTFKIEEDALHTTVQPQPIAQAVPQAIPQEQTQAPTTQVIPQEQQPVALVAPAVPVMPMQEPAPQISKEQEDEEAKKIAEMEKTMENKLKEADDEKITNYVSKKIIIGIAVIVVIGILSAGAYLVFGNKQAAPEQATTEQSATPPQVVNPFDNINQIQDQANPIEEPVVTEPATNPEDTTSGETPTETPSSLTPPSLTETPTDTSTSTSTETPTTPATDETQKRPRSRTISE